MPYFKARHRNASYSVVADKINQVIIPMSFDTGAVNTVISLSAYYNKSIVADYFAKLISESVRHKTFHTASGESLEGYLVCAEKVSISGFLLDRFYYYLLPMKTDRSVALLGDDFISNCSFQHEVQGDILVTGFDMESYYNGMQDAVPQNEVDRILRMAVN